MQESESKPALRISHIVHGRRNVGRRVTYLVDPHGDGDERAIPEEVVLRRWRRRRFDGWVFGGARLSSTLWRALWVMMEGDVERWVDADVKKLAARREAALPDLRARNLRTPSADTLFALLSVCGSRRLRALVERHASEAHRGRSGVPDLFLYTGRFGHTGKSARFVEVKKPEEPVSQDQLDEIAFMQSLGLHARVLRLVERG